MSDADKAGAQVMAAYAAAVHAKDVAALMRLYDPGVRVCDTWGVWSYEGAAAWQAAVEGWFTSLAMERVKVGFDEVRSWPGRDLTVLSATVTYTAVSARGETLRAMQNRLTWTLKLNGHAWRVVHEHTSAPAGFDDAKALLQRPASARTPG